MIRKATKDDLPRIAEIFAYARAQMKLNGNPTQWGDDRPNMDTVATDIENGNFYVSISEENKEVQGVFAFIIGEDETYGYIENGAWLNDRPYGTIHRIAAGEGKSGLLSESLEFCSSLIPNIRIDTHENNSIMRHLLAKNGFTQCGTIYVYGNSPRLAFQKEYFADNKDTNK